MRKMELLKNKKTNCVKGTIFGNVGEVKVYLNLKKFKCQNIIKL
jgi:hypothetical protein